MLFPGNKRKLNIFSELDPVILWNIQVLKSSRSIVIPDIFIDTIAAAVQTVGNDVVSNALVFIAGLADEQKTFMADIVQA